MCYETDLELVVSDDFIIGVDVEIDYTWYNDGIGWYEYGSERCFDAGYDYIEIDSIKLSKKQTYDLTKKEIDFLNSIDIMEWLSKNMPKYIESLEIEIENDTYDN